MSTRFRSLLLLLGGALAVGCGDPFGPITGLPRELSVAESQLIAADNRFAFTLFTEIAAQEDPNTNIFISPLSVAMALGMAYNGAAGTTREAMQRTLELEGLALQDVNVSYQSLIALLRGLDPSVEFLLANSVWYRNSYTFEQPFLETVRMYFDAEVTGLDFASPTAVETINAWVAASTNGTIPEIVTAPIDPLTVMFLINAIYFKGAWTYQFDRALTAPASFTLADGSTAMVDMMAHEDEVPLRVFADGDVQVADLAYGGGAYRMTIVLPREPAGIVSLANDMTQERWSGWIAGLDSTQMFVQLPKFTLEYELSLNDVLTALGMGIAFSPDSADFTNLYAGPERAYVSRVKHKTFVEVNEEGTEAAAATSVEVGVTSLPPRIVVDRPFLVAIRERFSGTIVFLGRIMDPSAM